MKKIDNDDRKGILRDYGIYVDVVLRFSITIVAFVFIGIKLDEYFKLKPLFIIICTFVGAAGAFYSLYKTLIKYEDKKKSAD